MNVPMWVEISATTPTLSGLATGKPGIPRNNDSFTSCRLVSCQAQMGEGATAAAAAAVRPVANERRFKTVFTKEAPGSAQGRRDGGPCRGQCLAGQSANPAIEK